MYPSNVDFVVSWLQAQIAWRLFNTLRFDIGVCATIGARLSTSRSTADIRRNWRDCGKVRSVQIVEQSVRARTINMLIVSACATVAASERNSRRTGVIRVARNSASIAIFFCTNRCRLVQDAMHKLSDSYYRSFLASRLWNLFRYCIGRFYEMQCRSFISTREYS